MREVRYAGPEDLPRLAEITLNCYRTAYENILPKAYLDSLDNDKLVASYKTDFGRLAFIVTEDAEAGVTGGAIFGPNRKTAAYPQYDCELYCLYVDPTHWFKGNGKLLFDFVKDELREQSYHNMLLWVFKENLPAVRFYQSRKGKPIGEEELKVLGTSVIECSYGYEL